MYSQPQMLTDSVFYFLSKYLNPGIICVGSNYKEIPGIYESLWDFCRTPT